MRDRINETRGEMPRFWPPKPSRLWGRLLTPVHKHFLHRHHGVAEVEVIGMDRIARLGPADGILLCPNHSYTGDGSVMMELGRRCPRPLHIMAAWHIFRGHAGLDGFMLQRLGCFSVDREGCDRRALRTAIEILATGRMLCVFPEGEIYHLNEKLTPLREGVAFMAVSAQRDIDKAKSNARVWMVPTAIRYRFVGDVMPALESAMTALEQRVVLRSPPGMPLHERIVRFGEMMLTLKEKEQLGRSFDDEGETLPGRVQRLMLAILARLEPEHLGKSNADEPVPVRVKLLRQHLLERLDACAAAPAIDAAPPADDAPRIRAALADLHLAIQLFSYPGNYISANPTPERMAETIEKFEEDIYGGYARPKGQRIATVTLGEPIDVREQLSKGKARAAASELTTRLESSLQSLMTNGSLVPASA